MTTLLVKAEDLINIIDRYKIGNIPFDWSNVIDGSFENILTQLENKMVGNVTTDAQAFIYGFLFGKDHLKFGYTTNIRTRLGAVKARADKLGYRVFNKMVFLIPCDTESTAEYLEQRILGFLSTLKKYNGGDWFSYEDSLATLICFYNCIKYVTNS